MPGAGAAARPRHDAAARGFASDNAAGMHPEVLAALVAANGGHVGSYGTDPYTAALQEVLRGHFGPGSRSAVLLTGTGANVVALQALTRRWESVLCSTEAHVLHDEGGALEHVGGTKLIALPTDDGLVDPADLERAVRRAQGPMAAPVGALTLTQSTELGTVYSAQHLRELVGVAHGLGVRVHVDGARLANAAVALGLGLGELTTHLGVDAVSLGGTKNGGGLAEVVVVRSEEAAPGLERLRKQSLQLVSKARFVSAQLLALFEDDLWLRNAAAANAAAALLARGVEELGSRVRTTRPVRANAVFASLPADVAERAAARAPFHVWDPHHAPGLVEARFVASFDTTGGDVAALLGVLREELAR
ncbi:threonine aldolase family protein [Kineococcus indalonis]|uniref:threonine aldolase family protein n=1 Tax=Kineococcus indalonis TaxID=2696566 RepID=UPI0014134C5C|nr:threonine aldolase [Kineococcus indalonis]